VVFVATSGQSKQLSGLTALIMNLKSLLEIMNQKREELVIAYAACENMQLNIQVRLGTR
jgi:hypothetical protein